MWIINIDAIHRYAFRLGIVSSIRFFRIKQNIYMQKTISRYNNEIKCSNF